MNHSETHRSPARALRAVTIGILLALAALFLFFSPTASQVALNAILLCGKTLIPSIFPFLVLSALLLKLGLAESAGHRLGKGFARLFGISPLALSACVGAALAGYPTGASMTESLRRSGSLTDRDADRTLLLASSASPAFLIAGVGNGLLNHPLRGLYLYLAQLTAILLVGILRNFIEPRRIHPPESFGIRKPTHFFTALAEALKESADTMIAICGTVIFFSVLSGFVVALPYLPNPLKCLLSSALEITSGASLSASLLNSDQAFVAIAAAVGWSGLSVHAQVTLVTDGKRPLGRYLAGKLLTALITSLFAAIAVFFNLV
ncbi:MAG: hypothetical protein E7618_04965 [Ruminococcaceae bacterium]|nr:hypothetical protein [Oscillospiraceae bacterium]